MQIGNGSRKTKLMHSFRNSSAEVNTRMGENSSKTRRRGDVPFPIGLLKKHASLIIFVFSIPIPHLKLDLRNPNPNMKRDYGMYAIRRDAQNYVATFVESA